MLLITVVEAKNELRKLGVPCEITTVKQCNPTAKNGDDYCLVIRIPKKIPKRINGVRIFRKENV